MDDTAHQLLDFLGSQARTATEWKFLKDLSDWEVFYNPPGRRDLLRPLAHNLVTRGLAEHRRLAKGEQIRLTPEGKKLATKRKRATTRALNKLGISPIVDFAE